METNLNFTVKHRSNEEIKSLLYSMRRELLDLISREERAELTQEIVLLSTMVKQL